MATHAGSEGTVKSGANAIAEVRSFSLEETADTIEDTTMSKPVFQALVSEMRRRNDFSVKYSAEKPGNRMSKRDRIQEILAQRFAVGGVFVKKDMYDLQREIYTFGPRMGHDDTIDALAYACKYAYPLQSVKSEKGKMYKHKPRAKSWVTA